MSEIHWHPYRPEILQRAVERGTRVLLQVTTPWCPCRSPLEDLAPEEREWLAQHFELAELSQQEEDGSLGSQAFVAEAWPTFFVLDAQGEVCARAVNLDAEGVLRWLRSLVDPPQSNKPRSKGAGPSLGPELVESVARTLLAGFDRSHGGFGTGQKFPHPEAIDFAILYYAKTQDPAYSELVQRSLEEMAKGALFDSVSGGFFRYCRTRDWRDPNTEIRLEIQSGLLRNYLEASQLFDRPDFLRVARKILTYLENHLDDRESGLWFGSQDVDGAYYALDEVRRGDRKPPPVERSCYTSSVAQCVSSLFKASSVLVEPSLHHRARHGLDALMEHCYRPSKGMFHSFDGTSPQMLGMLTDQVYTARALLHAYQYVGDTSYLALAQDLLDGVLRKESRSRGGFSDFAEDDPKYLATRRQNNAVQDNGVAAEALLRASVLCGRADYRRAAQRALASFAPEHPLYGYFTATFGRAVELLLQPPIQVAVVGSCDDPLRTELLETAHRVYVPSKLVLAIDPDTQPELRERHGWPVRPRATAWVRLAHCCIARTEDPLQLAAEMGRAERTRSRSGGDSPRDAGTK